MSSISPIELATKIKGKQAPKLLDVRQPEEHAIAAVPGSRLIPLSEIPVRLSEIEDWKDDEIVVYCHHGMRSAQAIGWLRGQGFGRLTNLTGGIDLWASQVDSEMPRY